jgi:hypothetical protein
VSIAHLKAVEVEERRKPEGEAKVSFLLGRSKYGLRLVERFI